MALDQSRPGNEAIALDGQLSLEQLQDFYTNVLLAATAVGFVSGLGEVPAVDNPDIELSSDPARRVTQLISPDIHRRERFAKQALMPLEGYKETPFVPKDDLKDILVRWLDVGNLNLISRERYIHRHSVGNCLSDLRTLFGEDVLAHPLSRLALRMAILIDEKSKDEGREAIVDNAAFRRWEFAGKVLTAINKVQQPDEITDHDTSNNKPVVPLKKSDNSLLSIIDKSPTERRELAKDTLEPVKDLSARRRNSAAVVVTDALGFLTMWLDTGQVKGGYNHIAKSLGIHRHTIPKTVALIEKALQDKDPQILSVPMSRWALRLLIYIDAQEA